MIGIASAPEREQDRRDAARLKRIRYCKRHRAAARDHADW